MTLFLSGHPMQRLQGRRLLAVLTSFSLLTLSWHAGADTYSYDAAGRLTAVAFSDGSSIAYTYDANGNLLSRATAEAVDDVPPVITLLGDPEVSVLFGALYEDAGATASDDIDGDISDAIVVSGSVDGATEGTYTLTYDVSDAAGNAAESVSRTVTVEADDPPRLIDDDENYWNAQIYSPTLGILSAEQVQLYRAYYGALVRLPDSGGYAWWLGEIQAGRHTLESMAAGFIFSPEFKGLADSDENGEISNEELILHIYNGVFGRPPDAEGFAWWIGELESGNRTQARAFIEMTQSNEYVQ
ncbi:MAG: YD repeat-containing protein, partial [Halieaceae bacterium]